MTVVRFEKLVLSGHTDPKKLLEVRPGEIDLETYTVPANKLLIKSEAFALNPTDWKHMVFKVGPAGALAGSDVSGTVVKIGSGVEGFEVGDDVSAFLHGNYYPGGNDGAFAGYTLLDDYATFNYGKGALKTASDHNGVIPAGPVQSFEGAASITLGLFTSGVTFNNAFELRHASPSSYEGNKVVIWGAATSTGILAIQVAKHIYKLKVIAVASSKHHDNLKKLGADWTYDYKTEGVVDTIKKEHPDIKYGFDTVASPETLQSTYDILPTDSILDNLLSLGPEHIKTDPSKKIKFKQTLLYEIVGEDFEFFGLHKTPPEVRVDFEDFLHNKLSRKFVSHELIHNQLLIINENHSFLKSVEEGLDLLRNDKVSGQKIVIRNSDVAKN